MASAESSRWATAWLLMFSPPGTGPLESLSEEDHTHFRAGAKGVFLAPLKIVKTVSR
jgi:hypothetical protein